MDTVADRDHCVRPSFAPSVQPTPAPRPIQSPIIRWLVYSHVWLALGAAAQVWWTYMYLSDRNSEPHLIAFTFFGTLSAYGFMRLMRAKGPLAEVVPLFSWVSRHRRLQWIMCSITGLIAFIAIMPLTSQLIGMLWWVVPICILYVLPFGYPERYFGLRAVPALKVPLVGIVWAVVTVAMPLRTIGLELDDPHVPLIFFSRVLLIMALTVAFDIRDAAIDPPGLHTIPQLLGDRGARGLAIAMMLVSAVLLFMLSRGLRPLYILSFFLVILGYAIATWLISKADRSRPEIFFGFTIDGMLILIPMLAWLGGMI